jgi:single stranded DNA-binding protein
MNELKIDTAGTLTKDPELAFTPQGKAVTRFSIAVNSSYRNDKAEWIQRPTVFLDCVVWNEQAERLAGACNTGDRVIISGQLVDASFEAQQGERAGQMIRRQEVLVDEVAARLPVCVTSGDPDPPREGRGRRLSLSATAPGSSLPGPRAVARHPGDRLSYRRDPSQKREPRGAVPGTVPFIPQFVHVHGGPSSYLIKCHTALRSAHDASS